MFLQDFFVDERLQQIIDVVATEMGVAVGGEDLVDVALAGGDELQHGNIEGAATEIVDGNVAPLFFVQAVSQRGGSRFVDQAQDLKPSKFSSVLGGLTLRVIEIGGHGDDGAVNAFAEIGLRP